MATSDSLGTAKSVRLSRATIDYRERGEGPPVVFVHGLLVNADLWRNVVPAVAEAGNRCIAPDWPLGSHTTPVPGADLTPPGVADMIAEFLDTLDLTDVTVVANDTGGALTQLLMTRHPERIGRVVLTPSDCFEYFFPPAFAPLPVLARLPGSIWMLTQLLRSGWLDGVTGIALGSWVKCGPYEEVRAVLVDRLGSLDVPIAEELGFGHCEGALTLPFGVTAELDADAGTLTLDEPALR